jgi:hypothetical protein
MNKRRAGPRGRLSHSSRWCNKSGEQQRRKPQLTRDTDYFHRRAAEARAAACSKDEPERVEIAGELALAYAALARRRAKALAAADERPAIPLEQPA